MKQKLFLSTAFLLAMVCSAQVKNETPEKEAPSKIRVYTPSTSITKGSTKDNSYSWVVKTDVLGFVMGEFPVAVEYRLGQKFSVEASAGITYAFFPNTALLSDDENEGYTDTKGALGSAFRGTFKYYPSSDYDAIEGWFFGVQAFNKTTNREYKADEYYDYEGTASDLQGKKDKRVKTGLSLVIGKQIFHDSNIAFESYIGIGFASVTRSFYTTSDGYDDVSGEYYSYPALTETKETVPNFQIGFKLGFGN